MTALKIIEIRDNVTLSNRALVVITDKLLTGPVGLL